MKNLFPLLKSGYLETAERLQQEAGIAISKFETADNLDLSLILTEYEAYYEMRYDRKPKLVRKLKEGEEPSVRIPSSTKGNISEKKTGSKAGSSKDPRPGKPAAVEDPAPSSGLLGVAGAGLSVSSLGEKKASGSVEDIERTEHR